jgi:RNA recognition motif-containing protein
MIFFVNFTLMTRLYPFLEAVTVKMETQSDTIFVTGLPKDVTSQEIETHFKLIGNIKVLYFTI